MQGVNYGDPPPGEPKHSTHSVNYGDSHSVNYGDSHSETNQSTHSVNYGDAHSVNYGDSHSVNYGDPHSVNYGESGGGWGGRFVLTVCMRLCRQLGVDGLCALKSTVMCCRFVCVSQISFEPKLPK